MAAPGRMDVVEQVLSSDRFFQSRLRHQPSEVIENRRGTRKRYSKLTVELVRRLAERNMDAVTMRRNEILAFAFDYVQSKNRKVEEEVAVAA